MRLTSYNVKINRETNRTELIKEKAINYSTCEKMQSPKLIVDAYCEANRPVLRSKTAAFRR